MYMFVINKYSIFIAAYHKIIYMQQILNNRSK